MAIRAEAHDDNHAFEIEFDAAAWFEQASDETILKLAECGWEYDYPADEVAIWMAEKNEDLAHMFAYIQAVANTRKSCGFECSVDKADAVAWLKLNRSHLLQQIEED